MPQKNATETAKLLRNAGLKFEKLSDIPLSQIRNLQRGAFPDMRIQDLAVGIKEKAFNTPILSDLLCTRVGYQGPSPAHYIPRPEGSADYILIFCTEGCGWLQTDAGEWEINRNEAFLIPQHTPHTYGADPNTPWSNYWVHFQGAQSEDYLRLIYPIEGSPIMHLPRREEVIAGIEQLYQYMSGVHTQSALVAASGALSQLLALIQLRMQTANDRCRSAEENIDQAVRFMQQNLGQRLTLKALAQVADMSPSHFGSLFAKRYERAPIDYFNHLKIQKACELLTTTDRRISEIGEALGFQDPYYFSRLFKQIIGVSPRNYR